MDRLFCHPYEYPRLGLPKLSNGFVWSGFIGSTEEFGLVWGHRVRELCMSQVNSWTQAHYLWPTPDSLSRDQMQSPCGDGLSELSSTITSPLVYDTHTWFKVQTESISWCHGADRSVCADCNSPAQYPTYWVLLSICFQEFRIARELGLASLTLTKRKVPDGLLSN